MSIVQFSFENSSVRTLGDAISPLFVAADLAAILGYGSTKDATRILDDDEKQTVSIVTNGGKQAMTAVTESGLYAMILKSRRPEAKRFRKWVTSEVLPAIRKNGHYEVSTASNTLSSEEQYEIRKAVKSRAKNSSIHYQTIYNALYDYFKIASYKDLTKGQLQAALTFIHTCELKPQLTQPEIPEGSAVITKVEAECFLSFVYYLRYLFRPQLNEFEHFLRLVDSPLAPKFWDLIHEVNFFTIESALERNGYSVKEMSCYKHLMTHRN